MAKRRNTHQPRRIDEDVPNIEGGQSLAVCRPCISVVEAAVHTVRRGSEDRAIGQSLQVPNRRAAIRSADGSLPVRLSANFHARTQDDEPDNQPQKSSFPGAMGKKGVMWKERTHPSSLSTAALSNKGLSGEFEIRIRSNPGSAG